MLQLSIVAAGWVVLLAVVVLLIYHLAVMKPALRRLQTLLRLHDEALGAGTGLASDRIGTLERTLTEVGAGQEKEEQRIAELERLAKVDLSLTGFVRYNAFDDTGSDLSYALALLNRGGDGIVLSSLYSRTDTRTYGKEVRSFTPTAEASDEELRAIARARGALDG